MATPVKVKEALKNAGGRPPKPESERTVVATVRLTPKRKARLKDCDLCESKIAVAYANSTRCPVCNGNLLRTPTDEKRLSGWEAKIAGLDLKWKARHTQLVKKKYKVADPTIKVWVVGGWCAT